MLKYKNYLNETFGPPPQPFLKKGDEVKYVGSLVQYRNDKWTVVFVDDFSPSFQYTIQNQRENSLRIRASRKELEKIENPMKISDSEQKFKNGDEVYFFPNEFRRNYLHLSGETGIVSEYYQDYFYVNGVSYDGYEVKFKNANIIVYEDELKKTSIIKQKTQPAAVKVGDRVVYNPALGSWQANTYKSAIGEECEIEQDFGDGDYRLCTPTGMKLIAKRESFLKVNDKREKGGLKVGSLVRCIKPVFDKTELVGKEGVVIETYPNNGATIKLKVSEKDIRKIFLAKNEFEIIGEPISKNKSDVEEKKEIPLENGCKVVCKKDGGDYKDYYNKTGIVEDIYPHGISVSGLANYVNHLVYLLTGEYEIVSGPEEKEKLKKGSKIICLRPGEYYNKEYNVNAIFPSGQVEILVKIKNGTRQIYLKPDEFKLVGKTSRVLKKGDRVIVNGKERNFIFSNRKGTVDRIDDDMVMVDFDEDDSKNMRSFSMLVNKKMVTYDGEKIEDREFKKGDIVICLKKTSEWFNKKGKISNVYPDGEYSVIFEGSPGVSYISNLKKDEIKLSDVDFVSNKKSNSSEEEEEEEDEDETGAGTKSVELGKDDLISYPYVDFFVDIIERGEVVEKMQKFEEILNTKDIPKFKKDFYEKSLKTGELIIQYYDFLIAKIAKGKKVVRTIDEISKELMNISTKVRASESKEMTKKYSFDSGIIVYWEFEDGIVFRTL